jgi:hypothetical protein
MSSVVSSIFGSGSSPGILGTGQYQVPTYNINQQSFMNPVGDQSQNWNTGMSNMLGATTGTAPQGQAATLGKAQTYGGAQMGPTISSQGSTVGPTATTNAASVQAAQMNAGQYNQTFGQEQGLAGQLALQAQGMGPSVAQVTAQQQAGQNLQNQMAMLGSQRGSSNPAQAQMAAASAGAAAQQQAAQQAVLGRTQEELGAQQSYGSLLSGMNQQAQNFAGTQANLSQQANLANAGFGQQTNLANQSAINAQNLAQAQLSQQNSQYNAGQGNAMDQAQAGLYQQAGLQNQSQLNQFTMQNAANQQQMALGNLSAQQAQNQLNAQQYNEYLNNLSQANNNQYQGQMAGQQLGVQQQLGAAGIQSGAYQNAAKAAQGVGGGIMGAMGMGMAAMA